MGFFLWFLRHFIQKCQKTAKLCFFRTIRGQKNNSNPSAYIGTAGFELCSKIFPSFAF